MSCAEGHCITCSDEGVEMRILDIDAERDLILCSDPEGAHHSVDAGVVGPLAAGDVVLVHAGVALVQLEGVPA